MHVCICVFIRIYIFLMGKEKFYQKDSLYCELLRLWGGFGASLNLVFLLLEETLELSNPMILKLQLYTNCLGCLLERQILGPTFTKFDVRVELRICFFNKYTQVFRCR